MAWEEAVGVGSCIWWDTDRKEAYLISVLTIPANSPEALSLPATDSARERSTGRASSRVSASWGSVVELPTPLTFTGFGVRSESSIPLAYCHRVRPWLFKWASRISVWVWARSPMVRMPSLRRVSTLD